MRSTIINDYTLKQLIKAFAAVKREVNKPKIAHATKIRILGKDKDHRR